MATLVFDTHAFVKQPAEAGMPEPQAEVLARTQAALIDERLAIKEEVTDRISPAPGSSRRPPHLYRLRKGPA